MLGHSEPSARRAFFNHLKRCEPWSNHPVLCNPDVNLEKLVPFTIHADGAQFYRDDEFMVWSFASAFGQLGTVRDVLIYKFPIAIIPERWMLNHSDPWMNPKTMFSFFTPTQEKVRSNCSIWYFCLVWKYLGKLYRCRLNFRKPDPTIAHLEVRSNVNAVIAKLASWSIKVASLGIGPAMGFHGEMFTKGSSRYKLVGKTLANGWKYLAPYIECKVL